MIPGPWIPVAKGGFSAHVQDTERKPGPYRWTYVLRTDTGQHVASGPARTLRLAQAAIDEHVRAWKMRHWKLLDEAEDVCPPGAPDVQDTCGCYAASGVCSNPARCAPAYSCRALYEEP